MNRAAIIVIDARRLHQTTGRYVRELLNNLQELDSKNHYHILIHQKDVGHWQPGAENFELHVVPWDHYTLGEQFGLKRYIKKLKPDLVHFTMPQQPYFYTGKKITTIHDLTLVKFNNPSKNRLVYLFKKQIFKTLLKKVAKTSEIILTDAEFTRAEIVSYANIPAEKIVIAHPASDAMAAKPQVYGPAENKQYIMYVGNVFPYKNIPRLIEAHQKLLSDHPDLYLFVVGKKDKDVERLEVMVKQRSFTQVHFTGFVSEQELVWLYKNAKAYVFPSLSEGFGMPGLEAMQFDLPVVSSDATCLPEIYGGAAHYFDPESIEEMTKSINEVLTDENLRQNLISNGRSQIKKYSWSGMTKQIHNVYGDSLK
jgi:glycosyltransferase involved in cell wall biosynthesis